MFRPMRLYEGGLTRKSKVGRTERRSRRSFSSDHHFPLENRSIFGFVVRFLDACFSREADSKKKKNYYIIDIIIIEYNNSWLDRFYFLFFVFFFFLGFLFSFDLINDELLTITCIGPVSSWSIIETSVKTKYRAEKTRERGGKFGRNFEDCLTDRVSSTWFNGISSS